MSGISADRIEELFNSRSSAIARDLKLNLKRLLEESALASEESLPALLATSTSVKHAELAQFAQDEMKARDFTAEQITEAAESAAIMGMLNTYYRFKHMVEKDDDYRAAGLRMTGLSKPVLGKERFEMLALAVSILNGCETCIKAHETVLRNGGVSVDKIHDLARLASVVKAIAML